MMNSVPRSSASPGPTNAVDLGGLASEDGLTYVVDLELALHSLGSHRYERDLGLPGIPLDMFSPTTTCTEPMSIAAFGYRALLLTPTMPN